MAKIWARLLIVFLAAGLFTVPAKISALDTQNFSFDSFDADYYLSRDSQKTPLLRVEETLVARFPDFDQNHGILRAIPERYQNHTLSLKILSVTDENGSPYHFTAGRQNDNKVLQIGDAGRYVHGVKTYRIKYEMRNVVNYQPDHDEFYWDINGDQWPQVFGTVTARIHIPSDFMGSLQDKQACYAGAYGSSFIKCDIDRVQKTDEAVVTSAASALPPYQTQTVVLAFDKGTFAPGPEIAREQLLQKLEIAGATAGIAIPSLLTFGLMLQRWRRFGDDPKGRGIIIPEYEPPKGFEVLASDFILSQALSPKAFSAMLIEMAVKRYLNVYEIPKKGLFGSKDYELELIKKPEGVSEEVLDGLKLVFGDDLPISKRAKLSGFKRSTNKIYTGMKAIEDKLSARLAGEYYFIKDPKKVKTGYMLWAVAPLLAGIGTVFLGIPFSSFALSGLGGGLIFASLLMLAFAFIMPARTLSGVQTNDALLGLKDYIKMAEADRLKYLQSPEGAEKIVDPAAFNPTDGTAKVKLFEKLLPYAMLFSLEKDWAKQFKDLYTQPPDWYRGNAAAFNIGYLGGSLRNFSKASGLVFAAPSSSSGSGFGGGAGGGGGGGGGGGW